MPKSYEEKYEKASMSPGAVLANRLNDLKSEIKVQLPARVTAVDYTNNQVDIQILDYDYDEAGNLVPYPIIPNIPIRQPIYSGSAYMILPVRIGDIGTIEFFDSSVDDLITTGNFDFDYTEEWHSLNYGLFTNGFLPLGKIIPVDSNAKIIMATSDNVFTFTVGADNTLVVSTPTMTLNGNLVVNGDITQTGSYTQTGDFTSSGTITGDTDVIAGGKSGKSHTHTGNLGSPTSAPN